VGLRRQEAGELRPQRPGRRPLRRLLDYVAYDPEHRLVLAVIPGARTDENGCAIVGEVAGRLGGRPPELTTSDEYPVYEAAIRDTFGEPVPAERGPGRPRVVSARRVPEGVVYATVHKHRKKGRVVAAEPRLVFGSEDELEEARVAVDVPLKVKGRQG
jgi:hypothetical protein